MSDRFDKGGSLVTDYSNSKMEPERARALNGAELDYVNGIWDETTETWLWPSYTDLAAKHDLPLRLINEQAGRHKWVSRRERRKSEMIAFQNEQTRKRWQEENRQITGILQDTMNKASIIGARIVDEHMRLMQKALEEEAEARANGDPNPVIRMPIRISEYEGLIRAVGEAVKTSDRLMQRISGLPITAPELMPPVLIKTVEQEEQEAADINEANMPKSTVLDIVREIRAIEEARNRQPKLIYGELEEDDDDDE